MKRCKSIILVLVFVIAAFTVHPKSAEAESYVGSNINSRVLVGLQVNSEGVQALLPKGWTSIAFPQGALKRANLLFALIDGILEMDAEGKPLAPASRRAAVLVGLAKQNSSDAVRMYVLRIMTTVPERNPYGVATPADIARTTSLTGSANGARASFDKWRVSPVEGEKLLVELNYTTGNRSWSSAELFPYSAANPDFSRIYRFDQMVDLVVSTALSKPSSGDFRLSNSIAELDPIFDGSEQIIAVMDVPFYVRKVYLP